jgi:hypothetical protein
MVGFDVEIDLESLVEQVHSPVAGSNHELPLDFLGLDLGSSLEENDGLLEHVVFGIMHSEARNYVNFRWVVSETFVVVVNSLELILFLLVQVAHFGENLRVSRHFGDQDAVPFEGLSSHSDQFVHMSDLVNHFVTVRNNCVQLFKSLETLVVVVQSLVNQS